MYRPDLILGVLTFVRFAASTCNPDACRKGCGNFGSRYKNCNDNSGFGCFCAGSSSSQTDSEQYLLDCLSCNDKQYFSNSLLLEDYQWWAAICDIYDSDGADAASRTSKKGDDSVLAYYTATNLPSVTAICPPNFITLNPIGAGDHSSTAAPASTRADNTPALTTSLSSTPTSARTAAATAHAVPAHVGLPAIGLGLLLL